MSFSFYKQSIVFSIKVFSFQIQSLSDDVVQSQGFVVNLEQQWPLKRQAYRNGGLLETFW